MASFSVALGSIKARLAHYVDEDLVREACREAGYSHRKRKLDPLTTVHLLLLQLLANVALIRLDRVAKLKVSAAAVCKARMRLPLAVWIRLAERVGRREGVEPSERFHGHRVFVADGSTALAADRPALAEQYGKASNQRKTRPGYPMPKFLCLMDLATGMIHKVIDLPHARGEQTVLSRMFRLLRPGDLLLADRGLVSFAHVALMAQAGVQCVLRLPKTLRVRGRGKGSRRCLRRLGRQDLLVRWDKPTCRPRSWMSRQRWAKLPRSVELRQVAFQLHRAGFRSQWAWAITTLTCPERYAARAVAELYGRRWQVEVTFRHLKRSLGMRQFSATTVHGVKKEILAFIMLYNLIHRFMLEAARRQGVPADRISFRDALTALLWSDPDEPTPDLIVYKRRPRATEPRARKHGGYKFPVLRKPREELRKPRAVVRIGAA